MYGSIVLSSVGVLCTYGIALWLVRYDVVSENMHVSWLNKFMLVIGGCMNAKRIGEVVGLAEY